MDEALEVLDLVVDSPLEGVVTWLFRLAGIVAVLAGLGLWLLTESDLLVVPAVLVVAGLVLLAVPSLLFGLFELL